MQEEHSARRGDTIVMTETDSRMLAARLHQFADVMAELIVGGVVERLRPELEAIRGAVPTSRLSEPAGPAKPSDLLTVAEAAAVLHLPQRAIKCLIYRTQ